MTTATATAAQIRIAAHRATGRAKTPAVRAAWHDVYVTATLWGKCRNPFAVLHFVEETQMLIAVARRVTARAGETVDFPF